MAKLKIGKLPVYKGEYQDDVNYSRLNQVSYLGTTFQSLTDDNIGHPPAKLSIDESEVTFINTNYWNIIAKGSEYNDNRIAIDSSKGYKILKKSKSFVEQVTKENTIYEIRHEFNLNNNEVIIPENCVLKFNGGTIINGTITFNNTLLDGQVNIVDSILNGTISNKYIHSTWFPTKTTTNNNLVSAIKIVCNSSSTFIFDPGVYNFTERIFVYGNCNIIGVNKNNVIINAINCDDFFVMFGSDKKGGTPMCWSGIMSNITFIAKTGGKYINFLGMYLVSDCEISDCVVDISSLDVGISGGFIKSHNNAEYVLVNKDCKNVSIVRCHTIDNMNRTESSVAQGSAECISVESKTNVIISNNICEASRDDLAVHNCKNAIISNNILTPYDGRLASFDSENVDIFSNIVTYKGSGDQDRGWGIFCGREGYSRYSKNVRIYNNVVTNAIYGIRVWGHSKDLFIYNNKLTQITIESCKEENYSDGEPLNDGYIVTSGIVIQGNNIDDFRFIHSDGDIDNIKIKDVIICNNIIKKGVYIPNSVENCSFNNNAIQQPGLYTNFTPKISNYKIDVFLENPTTETYFNTDLLGNKEFEVDYDIIWINNISIKIDKPISGGYSIIYIEVDGETKGSVSFTNSITTYTSFSQGFLIKKGSIIKFKYFTNSSETINKCKFTARFVKANT